MSDLYDNLLRATDNTNDITNEKYGVITKITNNLCNVKEENGDLEHSNVPILSNVPCETGDKVVIGFVNNSIYNPIVTGNLTRGVLDYVNEKIEGLEHPCNFEVLSDNLIFDFCDESGHGDPVTDEKPSTSIIESDALSNLGTTTGASQHDINIAIDSLINQGGGGGGNVNIVTEWETTPSNAKVPSEKLVKDSLDSVNNSMDNKISKSETAGLVKNDGTIDTNEYSPNSHIHGQVTSDGKITSTAVTVASGDNIVITDASDSSKIKRVANLLTDHVKDSSAHSNIGSSANATQSTINTSIDTALGNKISKSQTAGLVKNDGTIDTNTYSTFSGSYNDLSNKPTIPSKISDLTNDSDFIEKSSTTGLVKNDGSIDTTTYVNTNDSRLSDARTPTSHPHGNLQNDGKVGTSNNANKNVVTDSNGKITTENKPTIPTKISDLTNDSDFVEKSSTSGLLKNDGTVDTTSYSTFNGSYTNLTNKPSYTPTVTSSTTGAYKLGSINISGSNVDIYGKDTHQSLTNYVQKSSTSGLLKNDGTVDTTQYLSSLPSHNHDDRYYTESEMDDALDDKQDLLISGTNIKTINNTSLLGSGNISIGGGGSSVDIATSWGSPTSDIKVPSEKLTKSSLDNKISKSSTSGLVKNDGTIDTTSYSTFSGSYNDLTNKPTIPSKTSDLTNDSNFISKSNTSGLMKNDGTIDTTTYVNTNDSRLSDARTPLSHTHTSSQISDLIDVIYPIGSIYMSVNSTSPQTLFGGTWEQIKDTFLLASGDTYANGTTGGSADATLVSHQHGTSNSGEYFVTSESSEANNTRVTYSSSGNRYVDGMTSSSTPFHHRVGTGYVGSSGTGKNMPPYLTVFVWKRTA